MKRTIYICCVLMVVLLLGIPAALAGQYEDNISNRLWIKTADIYDNDEYDFTPSTSRVDKEYYVFGDDGRWYKAVLDDDSCYFWNQGPYSVYDGKVSMSVIIEYDGKVIDDHTFIYSYSSRGGVLKLTFPNGNGMLLNEVSNKNLEKSVNNILGTWVATFVADNVSGKVQLSFSEDKIQVEIVKGENSIRFTGGYLVLYDRLLIGDFEPCEELQIEDSGDYSDYIAGFENELIEAGIFAGEFGVFERIDENGFDLSFAGVGTLHFQ